MHYVAIMALILAASIMFSLLKHKTIIKPNVLFSALWVVGAFFVNTNFVGIHDTSDETNLYIILALVLFNAGYLLFRRSEHLRYDLEELRKVLDISPYWRVLLILNFTMVAICIPYFIKMLRILDTQSFYQVRVSAFIYSNLYELIMSKIIFLPMYALFNIILMLCVLKLVLGEKNFKLYALTVFDITFFSLITGSRNFIAKVFIYFVVAFLLGNSLFKKKRRINPKIVIVGVLIAIVLDRAIKARSLGSLSPIENVIVYLFGGIAYFDSIIHSGLYAAENAISLYGQGTFAWIISPLFYLLSLLSILPDMTAESVIGRVSENGIYISHNFNFNALTTALYPMWRDFKGFGIAMGMFVFGFISARSEKKLFANFNIRNFLLYFSFIIAICESTQLYDMLYIRFSVQILLIYLIFRKTKFKLKMRQ